MAANTIEFTDEKISEMASRFKILSEPSRLKILKELMGGELCVNTIVEKTGLMQANVSKQLSMLKKLKIITHRNAGPKKYYRIIDVTIVDICKKLCRAID